MLYNESTLIQIERSTSNFQAAQKSYGRQYYFNNRIYLFIYYKNTLYVKVIPLLHIGQPFDNLGGKFSLVSSDALIPAKNTLILKLLKIYDFYNQSYVL